MSDETKTERWSIRRWKQLEKLERLLWDCHVLNRGNQIVERIRRLEKVATQLAQDRPRTISFVRFLQEQARHDYASRKRKPRAKKEGE